MPARVAIIDFEPAHQPAFRALNHAWISRYFTLEAPDHQVLDEPQRYVLDPGGHILMAVYNDEIVGTCALIKEHGGVYELAKMAVAPAAQGLGIGWALGQGILQKARQLGAHRVELISNSTLVPALALYEKLGFRHVPLAPTPYQRGDVRMVLDLPAAG
ncbi:GNAT family N-acetyltransferase [Hymenobacter sp. PAMC 26628]|uniref:GNAT family N-acetyltransferase n=1 Tax=Hymenobacter sp. PAMC 26628 TaxID=1484118 RepID=UPI0007703562|nr:GNAT family N-acetyltransferase [Hymenobacter sp. PAMC 26628]AMJ68310.1 MarR family transcriptional regulator [Hymenobacter sp. PAMC 26628]